MGFTEVVTVILILLKIFGVIHWNWFYVLLPEGIAFLLYVVLIIGIAMAGREADREIDEYIAQKREERKHDR
jgi:hypothetical protein